MRKTAVVIALCFVLSLLCAPTAGAAVYEPPFEIQKDAAYYLINLDTNTVIFEQNADKRMYPASLTKIMTTILALEYSSDPSVVEITAPSGFMNEFDGINISTAGILFGETLNLLDLCYCMMLQSANEAASIVGDYIGGDRATFLSMMNSKAQELGAYNTNFANPHGLHDENNYTTAADMARIAQYAMSLPLFDEMVRQTRHTLPASNKRGSQVLVSTVRLQDKNSEYYYEPAFGIKTGSTSDTGRTLVTMAEKDGYTYLLVMLGIPINDADGNRLEKNLSFVEAKNLFEWAFEGFEVKQLANVNEAVAQVKLDLVWNKDYLLLAPEKPFSALMPTTLDLSSVQMHVSTPDLVKAPVEKGDVIGKLEFVVAGEVLGEINLVATESAERNMLLHVRDTIGIGLRSTGFRLALVIVLLLGILYMLLMMMINRRRKQSRPKNQPPRRR